MPNPLTPHLDWAALGRLRWQAQLVADGAWVGQHASRRRGAGLEFAGHRSYLPGDDLRWLDQRALMRHERLLVKQFETETERTLRLVVDATASMGFKSPKQPLGKLEFAALLAAALTRVAVRTGDPVGVDFLGGKGGVAGPRRLAVSGGIEAFERALVELSRIEARGTLGQTRGELERALAALGERSPRGTVFVVLSDLLDLGDEAPDVFAALGGGGRQVILLQVLDPLEASFPMEGPVRLKSSEADFEIETNASLARARYLEALAALQARFRDALHRHGGQLLICPTDMDPVQAVRQVLRGAERQRA